MEKLGDNGINISLEELVLKLNGDTRNKFINLDKEN